jgi:hypothetical protein
MSNRTQKRYAKKMLEKNTKITSELYDKSFVIDSEKLDSIEKIQKAFELLKIKFNPPNEEAYNEYKDILSEYIEK